MKKLSLYMFSIFCLTVFVLSSIKPFMEWWSDCRLKKLHLPYTRARYGDLYSSCFLPQFIDTAYHPKLTAYKTTKNIIDLYVLHDSYLAGHLKKENFIGVDSLILSDFREQGVRFNLNKKKQNILIIECSERSCTWRFKEFNALYSKFYPGSLDSAKSKSDKTSIYINKNYFFNPALDRNLEFNLFDYELLKPIKETKAILNFNLFAKTPPDIAISSDKKYLLLNETVDPANPSSSFFWMPDQAFIDIVNRMNLTYEHYRKLGFAKVYFTVIPNPVSIIDQGRMNYNHKIERIKNTSGMQCGFIDVYPKFLGASKRIYRKDDSHWNTYGVQLWVNEVNSTLLSY